MSDAQGSRRPDPSMLDGIEPESSAFVRDEPRSGTYVAAVLAGAVLVTVVLIVAVLIARSSAEKGEAEKAQFRSSFVADDPGEKGYVPPKLKGKLEVVWPKGIGGNMFEGSVVVGAVISPQGEVTDVELVKPFQPALDALAERTVWKLDYEPATRNGAPTEARILVEVPFEAF